MCMCNGHKTLRKSELTLGFQSNSAKITNAAAVSVIAALQANQNLNICLWFLGFIS